MNPADLIYRLTEAGPRLTEQVFRIMYANPFWHERYADRANTNMRNDGMFHISYVNQALAANDAAVIENYARWLQQLLTTRGMCTRHIADNFDLLAKAIAAEPWSDAAPALAMLTAANVALRYPAGPAADLQAQSMALVGTAAPTVTERHPTHGARVADDLLDLVSYLADSIALGSSKTFVDHVTWTAGFLERREIPRAYLVDCLDALVAAGEPAAEALAAARRAIGG